MVQEFLNLRNSLHQDEFRFDLKPELWRALYLERPGVAEDSIIKVYRQGELKGYAICALSELKANVRMFRVLEFCTAERDVMDELLARVIAKGNEKGADFIILAQHGEPFEDLLARNEFVDFTGSTVMAVLLDPKELLASLSAEDVNGRTLNLEIDGFSPISLMVGEKKIKVVDYNQKAEVALSMSDRFFLRLFFGRTSVLRAVLAGRIKVRGKLHLKVAMRFFDIIQQKRAYIPTGDGI